METNHKTSPQRVQAIRLFHLIQEFSNTPRSVITAESIANFLSAAGINPSQDIIKFLHEVDKEGKQMNKQYWGISISKLLSSAAPINTSGDIAPFHRELQARICGQSYPQLARFQQWDDNRLKVSEARDQTYAEIIEYWSELKIFLHSMDPMLLKTNFYKINRCLSICTLFPDKIQEVVTIYEEVLKGSFLKVLEYLLTMNVQDNSTLIEILKTLCYMYQGLKYPKIKTLLSETFLLTPQTLRGLIGNIRDPRIEIKYYTCAMAGLLSHNVSIFPSIILSDSSSFLEICQSISNVKQEEGLYYGLECLVEMVKALAKQSSEVQSSNQSTISKIFNFSIICLQNCKQIDTQAICLRLVSECIKVPTLKPEEMKILKVVSNVFDIEDTEAFQPLMVGALQIVQAALCYGKKQAEEILVDDKNLDHYMKKVLNKNAERWKPIFPILQICLILASTPSHSKKLIEKNLVQDLFKLAESTENYQLRDGGILLYLTEIVLQLVVNCLDSQWKITFLYEKNILSAIGHFLKASFRQDEAIIANYEKVFMRTGFNEPVFVHRQALINTMKTIYLLTCQTGSDCPYAKKKQLYSKHYNEQFLKGFEEAIQHFFQDSRTSFTTFCLKEEHRVTLNETRTISFKFFKLVSLVIEEMTYSLRKNYTPTSILKEIHFMRHQFLSLLYQHLAYHQLEAESIPIYLKLSIDIEGVEEKSRTRVYRLNWNQLRSFFSEMIRKKKNIEPTFFKILTKRNQRQIRNDDEYRRLLDEILQNYPNSLYHLDLFVYEIQIKMEEGNFQDDRQPMNIGSANSYPGSVRVGPNADKYQVPRFMSQRLPYARDSSPYGSTRRNYSPTFGNKCRYCSISTLNRSGICDNCVNRS